MKSFAEQVGVAAPVLFEDVSQGVGFCLAHNACAAAVPQVLDDHGGGGVGGDEQDFERWFFGFLGKGLAQFVIGHEEFVVGEFLAVLLDGELVFLKEGFVDGVAQLLGKGEGRLATGSGGDDEGEEVRVGGASVVHALDAGQATGKDSEGAGEENVTFPWVIECLTTFE